MRRPVAGSVLFYVQHLLGIGHLRRAVHLVNGMARAGLAVTLVSGGEPVLDLTGVAAKRVVQLPPIRAADATFRNLVAADGRPVDDLLWSTRQTALLDACTKAGPDAVLIEAYPFGRRAFRRELEPLIAAARAQRPRAVILCSLRDIVVAPADDRRADDTVGRVRADFDAVLVHGDPRLVRLEESFPRAAQIADRLVYTGYVGAAPPPIAGRKNTAEGEVLVSAGGGAVGGPLLRAALGARRCGYLSAVPWRLLTGPNLTEGEFAALSAELPDGVSVERYRADFPELLRGCLVSVSQAGYNTVIDIIAARAPAVLVPFAEGRETEQTLRAERLVACGAAQMVASATLSPQRLGEAIETAARQRPAALTLDIDGAQRTAEIVADVIRQRDRGRYMAQTDPPMGD